MTTSPTAEQRAVYDMITENTGIHMMDSGGSDGRMWQRNTKRTIDDFIAAPTAYLRHDMPLVSLFHILSENLIYLPDSTEELLALGHADPDSSWDELIEEWVTSRGGTKGASYYTYNYENSLDQDFICNEAELVPIEHSAMRGYAEVDETICIIRSHNGADARGGFSTPVVFTVTDGASSYDIADADIDAYCTTCQSSFFYTSGDGWQPCANYNHETGAHKDCDTLISDQLESNDEPVTELRCPHCDDGVLELSASFDI